MRPTRRSVFALYQTMLCRDFPATAMMYLSSGVETSRSGLHGWEFTQDGPVIASKIAPEVTEKTTISFSEGTEANSLRFASAKLVIGPEAEYVRTRLPPGRASRTTDPCDKP